MAIQDNISNDYLAQYNKNLGVSAVQKVNNFAFIQKLTYNGILESLKENFLGLQDWADQIKLYSATNPVQLTAAYNAIKTLVPLNTETQLNIIDSDTLGKVGNLFESIQGYDKVFSLSDSDLTDPSVIDQKSSNFD